MTPTYVKADDWLLTPLVPSAHDQNPETGPNCEARMVK
jgi:hypothetical protein